MHIDFNEIASMTFPGMDNGTGIRRTESLREYITHGVCNALLKQIRFMF